MTVVLVVEPVAVQLVKPEPSVIVGVAGIVKPLLKTAVIVSPAAIVPLALVVKVVVHVAVEPAVCGAPLKPTLLTLVAAAITTLDAGLTVIVSALVIPLKVVFV